MENKMREEFDLWWSENGGMDSFPDEIEFAFFIWKESRAALVVEPPSFENGSLRGYGGDCAEANMVVDSVAESLDAAGVSYK